jgi:L-2-hydroxyglutarate oxidase LhgO
LTDADCIVIGAGVIGLAVARALAAQGRDVIILERERHFGMHLSSRNSEVIHAGIHYKPNSLKARMCVAGRELLYRYCAEHGIDSSRCGKFTVATSEAQLPALEKIAANARDSGVFDLTWLDAAEARRLEPALSCFAALSSPSTGIIDSHAYMQALLADAERGGASIVYGTEVARMRVPRFAPARSSIRRACKPTVLLHRSRDFRESTSRGFSTARAATLPLPVDRPLPDWFTRLRPPPAGTSEST